MADQQQRINGFLQQRLDLATDQSSRLKEAMAYSLLSGGKRMRPLLVYATAKSIGLDLKVADYLAAAIEMIHAYSLIHDDLPAMDDDNLRRGKATSHIAFDEATAILAGDALQSLAFECLSDVPLAPEITVRLVRLLAQASGLVGMAGGQSLDLLAEDQASTLTELQIIHAGKTGAILKACVSLTVASQPSLSSEQANTFIQFAEHFGIAFQIIDDILDVTQDTETLGKPAHSDTKNNKSTYPGLLGVEGARNKANEHITAAIDALDSLPYDCQELQSLTTQMLQRKY